MITITDLHRLENENEEQFIFRLGSAKDAGTLDMNWEEIAAIINSEFRSDESEYRSEAAYRKPYQQAKRYLDANAFKTCKDEDSYFKELQLQKQDIRKEKQKLFDERTALNKTLRENARIEEDLSKLERLIKKNGSTTLPPVNNFIASADNDLFICLSDFHLGIDTDNYFGKYNSDIAANRLSQYLSKIIEIQKMHKSENAYVGILGDILNGEIHFTTQLENRENVTDQIQKSAELISAFIYELSKHFRTVYINGVAGNHSRTSFKDQVLRGNRLDNLIPWYIKAKLDHLQNVIFIDDENYDSTIATCIIRGNEYLMVHGDWDSYSESGVSKLVMMLNFKPRGIFYGHLHRCSYDDIANVKIIRSGSFSGTTDDYTISKRLSGKPSQMVCVIDRDGIKACYPVSLD